LAKYIQALSVRYLTFWPTVVAWRLPSVIFALASLLVFYFLAKTVGLALLDNKKLKKLFLKGKSIEDGAINFALIATVLLASDGLFLVQSRIAMNDIFYLFFALSAAYSYFLYLRQKNLLLFFISALSLSFALLTKWTALWLILFFFILELGKTIKSKSYQKIPFLLFCLVLTPVVVYFLAFIPYFLSGKSIDDFFALQRQIVNFQFNSANSHAYQSKPLAWIFNWRPVWYFADFSQTNWRSDIYAQGNPAIFLYFFLLPIFLWRWFKGLKNHRLVKKYQETIFQTPYYFLTAIFCFSFLPWQLVSRPLFFYHFLPALPYLLLLVVWPIYLYSLSLKSLSKKRALIFNFLFWPILVAIIFYPHWTGLSVPESAASVLYFFLPSWR
jgi:dolichyl-phosphate-mannose--protein O-mannosyl transferase